MLTRDPHSVCKEIEEYIFTQQGLSYLDLQTYAYNHDQHDWLWLLRYYRDYRSHISFLLRGKRKSEKIPYKHTYLESLKLNHDACKKYWERNNRGMF